MNQQVLVAGAGPVGMTLALALRRQGALVRIIDKAGARTDKSKALVIWPRTLELLDILGCAQVFIEAGVRASGARILGEGRELVHVHFSRARSTYPFALMIPQSETERLLEQLLAADGVQVERQVELLSFADDGQRVTAQLRHADGSVEAATAAWLAACDGAHSTVRHALNLPFEGDTLESDWVLADVRIDGELPNDELTICWMPEGVLACFPIGERRFRVIADVGPAPEVTPPPPTLAQVQALLDRRGLHGLRAHDAAWLNHFRINERKVKDYRHGRVFLAGDAAHVHSPAGGQGMNTGMQDAFNLAWKLALVQRGQAAPGLLDSYSIERSAIGIQVLRNAGNMTRVALLHNPLLRELRDLAASTLGRLPAIQQRMVDQLTELDLHYAHSPLSESLHGSSVQPAAGARAPDVALCAADGSATRLHALLRGGNFVLFSVGVAPPGITPALKGLACAASTDAAEDYEGGHHYLVRPDGYLALGTRGDDASPIVDWLQRLL
ncbi:MAG: FAD-dependent monooxygenase [Haliea sp.]|nr:FAD-dependent monooxygenase [Haliea sp.]